MALILCIETSSKNCSVVISQNGSPLFLKEKYDENYCHGEQLHVLIENILIEAKMDIADFDAFSLSAGPGSYTGLRIGSAAVKGLAFALNKPVISVGTLESMFSGFINKNHNYDLFFPNLDSRKGEVYAAMYDMHKKECIAPFCCEINKFDFNSILAKNSVCFFGPGNHKIQSVVSHKNASFIKMDYPSANSLSFLSEHKFQNNNFVDPAYFEPMYLKNFIATKSKKKVISGT